MKFTGVTTVRLGTKRLIIFDIDETSDIKYNPITVVYFEELESLQILAPKTRVDILCTGLRNVIRYIELYGNKDIALKFEQLVFDLIS